MKPKAVVVTGASSGLGLAIATAIAKDDGLHVVTVQRRKSPLVRPNVHFFECDLLQEDAIRVTTASICEQFDVLGLVNNAGSGGAMTADSVSWETIDRLNRLHVRASLLMMQGLLSCMKANRYGRIVNIGSRAQLGKHGRSAYASSKAALLGMTRVWALELGEFGITVNMVAPGPIATGLFVAHTPVGSERYEALKESIPVRKVGEPEDVAHAVEFFLSPGSGYITGQVLYVCGGMSVAAVTI